MIMSDDKYANRTASLCSVGVHAFDTSGFNATEGTKVTVLGTTLISLLMWQKHLHHWISMVIMLITML